MSASPTVLVCIPAGPWTWTETMVSLLHLRLPLGSAVAVSEGGATLVRKRNGLAEAFEREERFTHLLFLDSDQTPPPHTLQRLLTHDLPIVGALVFERIPPHAACAGHNLPGGGRRALYQFGGLDPVVKVDWHGTGCLLIRRDALLRIPKPWFDWGSTPGTGEDLYFCNKARRAGIPLHCDTDLCVGHIGVNSVTLDSVLQWQRTPEARATAAASRTA